jgi:glyoxylase-like metal-dependent hydrolase (beta-lactamase superfamily II)
MASLKVADRWFERRTLSDSVTWLWEPHVDPFIRCNIWHVRGRDRDLLVDTGSGLSSLRDELSNLIDRPVVAVATHIHYDHVGGLHEFAERLMHRIEAPRMNPYREFSPLRLNDFPKSFVKMFVEAGYKLDEAGGENLLVDAIPRAGWDVSQYSIAPTTPTQIVDDGDGIDLGNRRFEVMHLPGHSPGSIGLWEKKTGLLFSGDAIYDGPLLDMLPDSDVRDYVRTMKRLLDLPVTTVHGGHEPSFGRERYVAIANEYLASRGA